MSLGDVYYVLFRHKWKILLSCWGGLIAAGALCVLTPPPYQSEAKLMIQYVSQAKSLTLAGNDPKVLVPDPRGDDIINSEIQILTSLDLAMAAATNLGAATPPSQRGATEDASEAALQIRNHLKAEPANPHSSVIVITFSHADSTLVQPLLLELINEYFQKHHEVHSASRAYDDLLNREQTAMRRQLNDTEQQLAGAKNSARILSLDESKLALSQQISRIENAILDAQAELAGFQNETITQTAEKPAPLKQEAGSAAMVIPSDDLATYHDVCATLDVLRRKKAEYLAQGFTRNNTLVQEANTLIGEATQTKSSLEKKYPHIGDTLPLTDTPVAKAAQDSGTRVNLAGALRAKLQVWETQLRQLQQQATNLNSLAPTLSQLEQRKAIQAANYQMIATKLESASLDEALTLGKAPNIKWIQSPTPPFRDWSKAGKRLVLVVLGGILTGFGWAFLTELYLDRTVRRPADIQKKLRLPVILTIPDVRRDGYAKLGSPANRRARRLNDSIAGLMRAGRGDVPAEDKGLIEVAKNAGHPALQLFSRALRDRLLAYFEMKQIRHKPKLVAVTSPGHGSGVSTLAAGLAAALSETGDGHVLLVDMNQKNGAAQHFYNGKPDCGLAAVLECDTKDNAMVRDNLYVVTAEPDASSFAPMLPQNLSRLVPKLMASDFDYVIFDLPAVSQTSITSRLARHMDLVLLVAESEKTDMDVLGGANAWLADSGSAVSIILNKAHNPVPVRLHQDFLTRNPLQ